MAALYHIHSRLWTSTRDTLSFTAHSPVLLEPSRNATFRHFFHSSFRTIAYSLSSPVTTRATWICAGSDGLIRRPPCCKDPCRLTQSCLSPPHSMCHTHPASHGLTHHYLPCCKKRSWRGPGLYGDLWYPSCKPKMLWKKHCLTQIKEILLPAHSLLTPTYLFLELIVSQ